MPTVGSIVVNDVVSIFQHPAGVQTWHDIGMLTSWRSNEGRHDCPVPVETKVDRRVNNTTLASVK